MDRVGISAAPGPNTEGVFEPTASASLGNHIFLQGQRSTADLSAHFELSGPPLFM